MDIGEARRADNQIWNAAGAYGFATGSRGYEPNGEASLYFNTAIGLVRQLYDYKKLELLFTALERHSGGELQSELLWLGLERCAYLRCRDARPALTFLRQDYAQRQLQQDFSVNSEQDRLKIGWFRRALGLPSEESDREKQILDALEFDPDWDAEDIQTRMEQIVLKYFGRNLRNEIDHFNSNRVDLGFFARLMLRPGGLHHLGQAAPEGGVGLRSLGRRIFGWREARKDDIRKYAAACFGKSMLTPAELADAERTCCTGHHRNCVLHFTRGEAPETGEAPTREWEQIQEQTERNRAYFQAHLARNRLEIQRLAQQRVLHDYQFDVVFEALAAQGSGLLCVKRRDVGDIEVRISLELLGNGVNNDQFFFLCHLFSPPSIWFLLIWNQSASRDSSWSRDRYSSHKNL